VVGLGSTGKCLAQRLSPFGVKLIGVREHPERGAPPGTNFERIFGTTQLHAALAEADYVVLCLTYSEKTHKLIDENALAACKDRTMIVNVARGGVLDSDALLAALRSGKVAGAGLDVFQPEPIDPSHPILKENVIFTPHIGGFTDAAIEGVVGAASRNIRRYFNGEKPDFVVNQPGKVRGRSKDAAKILR
jgi:phosphoglycerate dehydrogenase-like enzyme